MKPEQPRRKARQYVEDLAAAGRYHFLAKEAQKALGISRAAVKVTLSRLAKRGVIASPARGFYVVVPPEYRSLGCLPADQFIPALMKTLNLPYYVGLLTAAEYHGAAHRASTPAAIPGFPREATPSHRLRQGPCRLPDS